MSTQIQIRRALAATWTSANTVLADGEPGLETDTAKIKYGDGVTAWNSLPYASALSLTADDITSGPTTNFYYTEATGNATIAAYTGSMENMTGNLTTTANIQATSFIGEGSGLTGVAADLSGETTDTLSEGNVNLYYTETRANAAIDARIPDTGSLTEGSNLYYTATRANAAIDAKFTANDTNDLSEGGNNLYWTTTRGNAMVAAYQGAISTVANIATTANMSAAFYEGNGSLLTGIAADLSGSTTSDLAEGTNLYWTTGRGNTTIAAYTGAMTNMTGALTTTSDMTANAFIGDGSQLTGLPAQYGDSNVSLYLGANDITIGGNLEVTGNLNVVNVVDLLVEDNSITLNVGNATARDGSIIIDRSGTGGGTNTSILWNETSNKWTFTNDGSIFQDIATSTTDLIEGTNLYWTTARGNTMFDARLLTSSTTSLPEGTNLYYTTARANSAIDTRVTKSYINALDAVLTDDTAYVDLTDGGETTGHIHDDRYFTETELTNTAVGTSGATQILMNSIDTPTYNTVEDLQRIFHSAAYVDGGQITDAGSGNIQVAAGTGLIRNSSSKVAPVLWCDWDASGNINVPSNTTRYIGVVYVDDNTNPVVESRAAYDWDFYTEWPLGKVYNENGVLHIEEGTHAGGDHASLMIQRLWGTMPYGYDKRLGGLQIANTGTRNLTVTTGRLWERLTPYDIPAIDTSVSDTFDAYYRDGGGSWIKVAAQTQWDNANWDNGTGTLDTFTNNDYGNHWVYLETDGSLVLVYGQGDHGTLAIAEAATAPATLPPRLSELGILIGRITFQEGTAVLSSVASAFSTSLPSGSSSDHGSLGGLLDDDHTQYVLVDGTRSMTGNLTTSANVSATAFIGSGAALTGVLTSLSGSSTTDLSEGTNLYYTTARSNTAIAAYTGAMTNMAGNITTTANVSAEAVTATTVNLTEFNETVYDAGNVTGAASFDMTNGSIQKATVTGNITSLALTNAVAGTSATIILTQDATGGRTLTSTWKFAGGSKTLSPAASAIDIISVIYDGTTYYATLSTDYS